MTRAYIVQYLANILHVIYADQQVFKIEEKLLNRIAQAIGGSYQHIDEAVQHFQQEDFKILFPFNYSMAIRNVEDMLTLSLADGSIDPMEKESLQEAILELGLSRKQFMRMYQEVKDAYAS